MIRVDPWVQSLVEEVLGKSKMKIGEIIDHPDGYKVKVISGQYWGEYGLSNFWYWKRVNEDGSLSEETYSGYGW
jgi:hypothetical protein